MAKSLLRYPGGKTRAVDIIEPLIPREVTELVSPFFGGGSIEFAFNERRNNAIVHGCDLFFPVATFWHYVINNPEELADAVQKEFPCSKERFYELQQEDIYLTLHGSLLNIAKNFFVLNRCSFSGSTMSGGMSPGHPRFMQSNIDKLRAFRVKNLSVEYGNCIEFLHMHEKKFAYLDPPYLIKGNLYGKKGSTHRDFNHVEFRNYIEFRKSWILSYNDCPEIRQLYEGFRIETPTWAYGMSKDKKSKEVIIYSKDM